MFTLNDNYEVDQRILQCDYVGYSLAGTSSVNTPHSLLYINIPREDSVSFLFISYFDINFELIRKADKSRYANGDYIRLVNLELTALFSSFRLTTSSRRHLEDFSHAFTLFIV